MTDYNKRIFDIIEEYENRNKIDRRYRERILSGEMLKRFKISEEEASRIKKERGIAYHIASFSENTVNKVSNSAAGRVLNKIKIGAIRLTSVLASLGGVFAVMTLAQAFYIPLFENTTIPYLLSGLLALVVAFRS